MTPNKSSTAGYFCLLLAWLCASLAGGGALAFHSDKAVREIQRLPPSAFPALPAPVAAELHRRGCLVPQVEPSLKGSHNVISGQFRGPGQTDWAVLCSVDLKSSLLVFWNGSATEVEVVGRAGSPDGRFLQGIGGGRQGFSWAITPVGRKFILDYYAWSGGTEPPEIDHEGINSAFVEKASTVLYWLDGEWLRLPGAD